MCKVSLDIEKSWLFFDILVHAIPHKVDGQVLDFVESYIPTGPQIPNEKLPFQKSYQKNLQQSCIPVVNFISHS